MQTMGCFSWLRKSWSWDLTTIQLVWFAKNIFIHLRNLALDQKKMPILPSAYKNKVQLI